VESREQGHLVVSDVKFRSGDPDAGVLVWASCVVNGALVLENIAVRRTASGRASLRFPTRRTSRGEEYFYFHPINSEARSCIESAILDALQDLGAVADVRAAEQVPRRIPRHEIR